MCFLYIVKKFQILFFTPYFELFKSKMIAKQEFPYLNHINKSFTFPIENKSIRLKFFENVLGDSLSSKIMSINAISMPYLL